eukprot:gene20526-31611_t
MSLRASRTGLLPSDDASRMFRTRSGSLTQAKPSAKKAAPAAGSRGPRSVSPTGQGGQSKVQRQPAPLGRSDSGSTSGRGARGKQPSTPREALSSSRRQTDAGKQAHGKANLAQTHPAGFDRADSGRVEHSAKAARVPMRNLSNHKPRGPSDAASGKEFQAAPQASELAAGLSHLGAGFDGPPGGGGGADLLAVLQAFQNLVEGGGAPPRAASPQADPHRGRRGSAGGDAGSEAGSGRGSPAVDSADAAALANAYAHYARGDLPQDEELWKLERDVTVLERKMMEAARHRLHGSKDSAAQPTRDDYADDASEDQPPDAMDPSHDEPYHPPPAHASTLREFERLGQQSEDEAHSTDGRLRTDHQGGGGRGKLAVDPSSSADDDLLLTLQQRQQQQPSAAAAAHRGRAAKRVPSPGAAAKKQQAPPKPAARDDGFSTDGSARGSPARAAPPARPARLARTSSSDRALQRTSSAASGGGGVGSRRRVSPSPELRKVHPGGGPGRAPRPAADAAVEVAGRDDVKPHDRQAAQPKVYTDYHRQMEKVSEELAQASDARKLLLDQNAALETRCGGLQRELDSLRKQHIELHVTTQTTNEKLISYIQDLLKSINELSDRLRLVEERQETGEEKLASSIAAVHEKIASADTPSPLEQTLRSGRVQVIGGQRPAQTPDTKASLRHAPPSSTHKTPDNAAAAAANTPHDAAVRTLFQPVASNRSAHQNPAPAGGAFSDPPSPGRLHIMSDMDRSSPQRNAYAKPAAGPSSHEELLRTLTAQLAAVSEKAAGPPAAPTNSTSSINIPRPVPATARTSSPVQLKPMAPGLRGAALREGREQSPDEAGLGDGPRPAASPPAKTPQTAAIPPRPHAAGQPPAAAPRQSVSVSVSQASVSDATSVNITPRARVKPPHARKSVSSPERSPDESVGSSSTPSTSFTLRQEIRRQ